MKLKVLRKTNHREEGQLKNVIEEARTVHTDTNTEICYLVNSFDFYYCF